MDDNPTGDQVSKVGNGLKGGIATTMETVTDWAGKGRTAAVQAGSTIRNTAIETGKQVSDAAAKTYAQGARATEYVSSNTAEQPLLALLIAGAIGYGIAYLIHGRQSEPSQRPELPGAASGSPNE
jgi:hypothetical protein